MRVSESIRRTANHVNSVFLTLTRSFGLLACFPSTACINPGRKRCGRKRAGKIRLVPLFNESMSWSAVSGCKRMFLLWFK